MKIWIIGKRGTLSQAMQRKCKEKGIDYIATSKEEVDLENPRAVRAQFETGSLTHVINCAAYTDVDLAEQERAKAYALNASAVALLSKLSRERATRLIHFSTDYVFDGVKGKYAENNPTSPLSEYGRSKAAGERFLMAHNPEALLIRTSWLFGKEGQSFVKKMVELMEKQEKISVVSDQRGLPTYADDLAESALSILDASGIYHFANQGETTWYEFAQTIRAILQKQCGGVRCQLVEPISSNAYNRIAKRPRSSILLTQTFSPRHWREGLEEVLTDAMGSK